VKQSGVMAVGGDHITNDMSIGLKIPTARAEKLKMDEGDVTLGIAFPGETIMLRDETGFAGREIERETLNQIIRLRIREIFDIVRRQIEADLNFLGAGVFITGGSSQLRGIDHLAGEVFGIPARMTPPLPLAGVTSAFEHPQFSTALGLVKYAHFVHLDRPAGKSFFGRTIKKLSGIFRS
jgi:cell division protein FtsA